MSKHKRKGELRMSTIAAGIQSWQKRVLLIFGILTLATTAILPFAIPNEVSAAGCNVITLATSTFEREAFSGRLISSTPTTTVPGWSTCRDIQIKNNYTYGSYFRVRFFRSDGTSFTGSEKYISGNSGYVILATNVLDGTRFRIERLDTHVSANVTIMD